MGWYTREEAAVKLGIAGKSVESRCRRGKVERKPHPAYHGRFLYRVDDDEGEGQEEEPEHEPARGPARRTEREEGERYIYAVDPDGSARYIIKHRSLGGGSRIYTADTINALWSAYTTGRAQINEVCREFGLRRVEFQEIKQALGLTKTSAPWPGEVIEATAADDLVEDDLAAKTRSVMVRAERKHWARLAKAGEDWLRGPAALLEHARRLPIEPATLPDPVPHPVSEHYAVIGLTDVHLGKRPIGGIDDPADQARRALALVERARREAMTWGTPRRWLLHCGGDLLHVDGAGYTTTRGTPQGGQSTGSVLSAYKAAVALMAGAIELLAKDAPVTVVVIPGNHDWILAQTIGAALELRYQDVEGVQVDIGESCRRVYRLFDVPVMFDHGDSIKARDYPLLLARMMPRGCVIERGVIFRGHLHAGAYSEEQGVAVVTMPSPGVQDDWHEAQGYHARPRLGLYRVEAEGLVCSAWVG